MVIKGKDMSTQWGFVPGTGENSWIVSPTMFARSETQIYPFRSRCLLICLRLSTSLRDGLNCAANFVGSSRPRLCLSAQNYWITRGANLRFVTDKESMSHQCAQSSTTPSSMLSCPSVKRLVWSPARHLPWRWQWAKTSSLLVRRHTSWSTSTIRNVITTARS